MSTTYSPEHWTMRHEARYAQRLCERTARFYRRAETAATFLTVLGGSAVLTATTEWAPAWVPSVGAVLMAVIGAAALAVRPADRAAQNEGDVRKYAELLHEAPGLSDEALAAALAKARVSDAPEIESARDCGLLLRSE